MEGNFARAPPGHTNYATRSIALPTRLTTGHSSVQSSTARSSEAGTTPGGHIPKWTVSQACHEYQGDKGENKTCPVRLVVVLFPSRSRCVQAVLLCWRLWLLLCSGQQSERRDPVLPGQLQCLYWRAVWGNTWEWHVKRSGSCFLWTMFSFPQRVGCDRVLGSTAVPDTCGVCKGDNSTCKIYKGQYTKQHYTNRTTYSWFCTKDFHSASTFLLFLRVLWSSHYPGGGSRYTCDGAEYIQLLPGCQGHSETLLPEWALDSGLARSACHRWSHFWVQETL